MPVRIRAKRAQGFWRCKCYHPATWVEYPDGRFSAEEIVRLRAEPMIEVEIGPEVRPDGKSDLAVAAEAANNKELAQRRSRKRPRRSRKGRTQ